MPIDFNKIAPIKKDKNPIHPIDIFQSLTVKDPSINDLWLAQGDALREWHSNRTVGDVSIVLNTGAGKTLVGLLAAQSLVNETNGHVVYACSSIQLIKQTEAKALGYGLNVTTYFAREFSNNLYKSGLAPCITTYQALFNGKSRFYNDEICAVVFDDAHTAEHLLRDHFTVQISRESFLELYTKITELFKDYHLRIERSVGYIETIKKQDQHSYWFIPPFAIREQLNELRRLLISANLCDKTETMFSWEHIKNHLDLCVFFVTGNSISITPGFMPTRVLPYFQKGVRRLYLSATLAAKDAFLRTFGKVPDKIIAPKTTAGECERLIIIPSLNKKCENDLEVAKELLKKHKVLVLVPGNRRAAKWQDVVDLNQDADVSSQVENFKRQKAPASLLLVSRYDGIDLPGDTCRVMIIDDQPSGVGLLERYLWEKLGLVKSLRSTVASRIVQSFGRISRGMSDHGAVIITGKRLVDEWLLAPKNRALLPIFLQKQLDIGINLSKQALKTSDLLDAVNQCLNRDPGWIKFYQDSMQEPRTTAKIEDEDDLTKLSEVETKFGHYIWCDRDYISAAKCLSNNLEETFKISRNSGAWHALWLGYCYELMGDSRAAHELYKRAYGASKNIPPFEIYVRKNVGEEIPDQVLQVERQLIVDNIKIKLPQNINTDLAMLDKKGSPAQVEEALRALGEFLGMNASRPDNEFGTGPDVLWESPGKPALCMEVKTDMEKDSCYQKKYIGQLLLHMQWVKENSESTILTPCFVGPVNPACPKTSPGREIVIIELDEFRKVAEVLLAALRDICSQALPLTLRHIILDVFAQRKLLWPELLTALKKYTLHEIK